MLRLAFLLMAALAMSHRRSRRPVRLHPTGNASLSCRCTTWRIGRTSSTRTGFPATAWSPSSTGLRATAGPRSAWTTWKAPDAGKSPCRSAPILITVDDGYRSLYTRVFPLALAYRTPIVAALVGEWLDTPDNGSVAYGQIQVPRSHFITWDQAREMQASGLVEFASHSYALHDVVLGNPQGNLLPAATTRRYSRGPGLRDRVRIPRPPARRPAAIARAVPARAGPRATRRSCGPMDATAAPPWRRRANSVSGLRSRSIRNLPMRRGRWRWGATCPRTIPNRA